MKVVAVLYPDDKPDSHPDVLASTERGLDLGERLRADGHELVTTSDTGDELDAQLDDAEIVVTTPFWPLYLGRDRIEKARNLKLVITAGVGSDHVDADAATEHGITVAEVTGSNVVSVAEHNVLQILALVRNFVPAYRQAVDGRWDVADAAQEAHDLEGKTVGMVGLGAIGARTALRLKGFDVTTLYYAKHRRSPAEEATLGVRYARLDDLVAESDVVCAALPLTPGSGALFDADRIAAMKRGSWLVNTARGAIADTDAVREACGSGHLAGYAGDTWYPQPAPPDHPWRTMPRHAMTIHYSGMTVEAQRRIVAGVREIVDAHLAGEPVPADYVVAAPENT